MVAIIEDELFMSMPSMPSMPAMDAAASTSSPCRGKMAIVTGGLCYSVGFRMMVLVLVLVLVMVMLYYRDGPAGIIKL